MPLPPACAPSNAPCWAAHKPRRARPAACLARLESCCLLGRRSEARVQQAVQEVAAAGSAAGGAARGYVRDLASLAAVRQLAADVRADFPGGIDVLVNNAGVYETQLRRSEVRPGMRLLARPDRARSGCAWLSPGSPSLRQRWPPPCLEAAPDRTARHRAPAAFPPLLHAGRPRDDVGGERGGPLPADRVPVGQRAAPHCECGLHFGRLQHRLWQPAAGGRARGRAVEPAAGVQARGRAGCRPSRAARWTNSWAGRLTSWQRLQAGL